MRARNVPALEMPTLCLLRARKRLASYLVIAVVLKGSWR